MENFYNSLVLAMLGPGASPADPKVALSPQLLYTYKAFVQSQADLAKAYRAAETKEMLGKLKNDVSIFSAAQKAKTSAIQEIAQSSRVSAQNITKLRVAANTNAQKARNKNTAIDEGMIRQLETKAKATANTTGMEVKQAFLHDALNAEYVSADLIDPDNTKANGTVNKALLETVQVGLDDPQIVEKVSDYFAGSPYRATVVAAVRERKVSWDGNEDTIKQAASLNGSLTEYEKMVKGTAAGAPGAADQIKQANALMQAALSNYGATLDASAGKAKESMELTQDYFDNFLSQSLKFKEVSEFLADEIMGKDPGGSYRGKLVSGKDFIAWAKDNGFENLGYMKNGVYVEGADDTDAIYLFQYQRKNPDKYRPGIRRDLGDTDDLIVVEKKASKEYLDSLMTMYDEKGTPQFFIRRDENGEVEYMKEGSDPLLQLYREGGTRLNTPDGTTLMVNFRPGDIFDTNSDYYKYMKGLEERGELTSGEDTLTVEQIQEAFKASPEAVGKALVEGLKDEPMMVQALGVNKVDIDGNVSAIKDTAELSKLMEDFTANDKTYKMIGREDTEAFFGPDGVAPEIQLTDKIPTEKVVGRRQRMHATHTFTKDGPLVVADTAYGEIKFASDGSDGWNVTESYDEGLLGNRAGIFEAEKALAKTKKKQFGYTPSELDVKEVEAAETDEEQEAREKETALSILTRSAGEIKREGMRAQEAIDELSLDDDFDATPEMVGASRRRQQRELRAEDAERRLGKLTEVTGTLPGSVADMPVLQPYSDDFDSTRGVFMDPRVIDAETQRRLRQGVSFAPGLPRLTLPVKGAPATTQITDIGIPSHMSGPVALRMKARPKGSLGTYASLPTYFSDVLTPMKERNLRSAGPVTLFAPTYESGEFTLPERTLARRVQIGLNEGNDKRKLQPTPKTAPASLFAPDYEKDYLE